jgi:hypothetical protein
MTYKLKEKPKMVYSLETKQFTIVDTLKCGIH